MTELQDPEFRFRLALQAARLGVWEYDLRRGVGRRSPDLRAMLGADDDADAAPLEAALRDVHPADRERVVRALSDLVASGEREGRVDFRYCHPDGRVLWLDQHVFVERGPDGHATHVYSLVQDVTDARRTEQALQHLNATLEERVAERTRELEAERAALDAFVAFTETASTALTAQVLARHAVDVLQDTLGAVTAVYLERDGDRWQARAATATLDAGLRAQLERGFPVGADTARSSASGGDAVFLTEWRGAAHGLSAADAFPTVAVYPCVVEGEPAGLLVMGSGAPRWTPREQAVFRAVGRSLMLALERAAVTSQLRRQNEELAARTRAMEAFTALTRDLTLLEQPAQLIRRAQEVILSVLPPGTCVYAELEGGAWRARVRTDSADALAHDVPDGALLAALAGPLDRAWTGGRPDFSDAPAALAAVGVRTCAVLPVHAGNRAAGVLAVAVAPPWSWSPTHRTVLDTTTRSLGVALERAEQARDLDDERASLAAFTAFTESVGSETDVPVLVRRALTLLEATHGVDAAYFERRGDTFVLREWTPGLPAALLDRCRRGIHVTQPSFAAAAAAGRAVFVEDWDADEQGIAESGPYRAVALHPLADSGGVTGMLVMGPRGGRRWEERDRKSFGALGRSLGLALDRAAQARQLQVQRDALDERSASLTAANEELEAFSYSVSHDLRTPVRHVIGFVDLTRSALDRGDHERARRSLDIVSEAAQRMNTLIDGMLELSRAGREGFTPAWVDVDALVAQARRDAAREFPDRPVTFTVTAGQAVWGDPDLLQQVMTNLVSNAVKYSGSRDVSEVTVTVEGAATEWTLSVHDNGVGYDERYAHKLFGVFQRLHAAREFQGTGVGLATVRRIVLRHGGSVFARSPGDAGATFGFTLPRPPAGTP